MRLHFDFFVWICEIAVLRQAPQTCAETVEDFSILLLGLLEIIHFVRYADSRREVSGQFLDGLFVIFVFTDVLKRVEDLVDPWTAVLQQKGSFSLVIGNSHSNG